jgi:VanZ family protein
MSKRTIAAAAWTLVLVGACLFPSRWLHAEESRLFDLGVVPTDKLVHAFLFGLFGLLWMRAARSRGWAKWVIAVGLLLAVATELGQTLPAVARDADRFDVLADVIGLLVGFGAFRAFRQPFDRRAEPAGEA